MTKKKKHAVKKSTSASPGSNILSRHNTRHEAIQELRKLAAEAEAEAEAEAMDSAHEFLTSEILEISHQCMTDGFINRYQVVYL